MLALDDPRWKELKGGYRTPYDASPALKALETSHDQTKQTALWNELWDELHHQGDVGEASYAAVPHLLRIVQAKPRLDWNCFALIAVIELERHRPGNPAIPADLKDDYQHALGSIMDVAGSHADQQWDALLASSVFAAVAAAKGLEVIARALLELDSGRAQAFMDQVVFGTPADGS